MQAHSKLGNYEAPSEVVEKQSYAYIRRRESGHTNGDEREERHEACEASSEDLNWYS
jgi:hypothetical protein